MSTKGDIYKELCSHLMAALAFPQNDEDANPHGLPALQWTDLNKGQFTNPAMQLGVPMPAVLIRFATADWTSLGKNVQDGAQIIEFEIGYENYAASYQGSIDQDEALKFLQFQEEVYKALQGFQGTSFSALQRVADEDLDDQPGGLIITRMSFATIITDTSAESSRNSTLVTDVTTRVHHQHPPLPEDNRIDKGFVIPG